MLPCEWEVQKSVAVSLALTLPLHGVKYMGLMYTHYCRN